MDPGRRSRSSSRFTDAVEDLINTNASAKRHTTNVNRRRRGKKAVDLPTLELVGRRGGGPWLWILLIGFVVAGVVVETAAKFHP